MPAHDIALNLRIFRHRWPFLGYRLPRGRRLYLDGDAGDFVGALLDGGEVVVTGNAGNYTSIGMKTGTVQIGYSTGKYTGEGMRGGTLRVGGRIAALGRVKQGVIYEGDLQVISHEIQSHRPRLNLSPARHNTNELAASACRSVARGASRKHLWPELPIPQMGTIDAPVAMQMRDKQITLNTATCDELAESMPPEAVIEALLDHGSHYTGVRGTSPRISSSTPPPKPSWGGSR